MYIVAQNDSLFAPRCVQHCCRRYTLNGWTVRFNTEIMYYVSIQNSATFLGQLGTDLEYVPCLPLPDWDGM